MAPTCFPPATPISASLASPGPLTTQPITATLIGFSTLAIAFSTLLAKVTRSISVRPQVGQEIKIGPFSLNPSDFKISKPTLTSSVTLPVKETLIVSPIPWARRLPIPTALLIDRPNRSRLGNSKMQRIIIFFRKNFIGFNCSGNI